MTVPSKTFASFVQDMTTQWGASINQSPVLSAGSMLLAIFESVSSQLDFMQAVADAIVLLSRAATSTGGDLDTWMADFNFARLPATYAVGPVELLRNTPASSIVTVPAATLNSSNVYVGGGLVQTLGGAIVYQIVPDTSQTAYSASSNSYQFPIGSTSITVTAQAVTGGSASNVGIGALVQLGSQLAGVDASNNTVPINNGVDAEADDAFRSRFVLYLSTLAEATKSAILAACRGVQQGLQVATQENVQANGSALLGSFTVFVDDGTGNPPQSLLNTVYQAADAVRAFSIQPFVSAPNIQTATIVLSVRLAAGYTLGGLQTAIKTAVVAVVNSLNTNDTLFVYAIDTAAGSVPGVVAVQPGTTIDGFASDLTPNQSYEIRTTSSLTTVGSY